MIGSRGEVVADTAFPRRVGLVNLLGEPVVSTALKGKPLPEVFTYQGRPYYPAATHSVSLDWYFFVRMPAGLHNEDVRGAVMLVVLTLPGSLRMGILLSPSGPVAWWDRCGPSSCAPDRWAPRALPGAGHAALSQSSTSSRTTWSVWPKLRRPRNP